MSLQKLNGGQSDIALGIAKRLMLGKEGNNSNLVYVLAIVDPSVAEHGRGGGQGQDLGPIALIPQGQVH
jgi:hypothetical protein